ncbi:MAG: DNA gyrase inhibitor YacG [Phycisphaerae bacterium]|nr:DNA gyrase inhibitor YacG [Phycisphaerae bacterium]MDD5380901.1 DNA gyrase inhibitor YacG [Phycisphaerae bacterium]
MKHRCPTCKKPVKVSLEKQSEEAAFFPFCSQRCKLIDLGAWLDDKYRIVTKSSDTPTDTSAGRR